MWKSKWFFHGDEILGLNFLGVTEFCKQTLSSPLYRGPCVLELYKTLRRSRATWRWRRAASWALCMSARFCCTNWCTSYFVRCSGEGYWMSRGTFISSPKTRNWGVVPVDIWTELQKTINIYGSCWVQLLWKSKTVLANMFSKVLFIRLITAFDCGWKYVVRSLLIWRNCIRLWKKLHSRFRPWSVWMLTGTPKRPIQCSSSAVAVISAVWLGNGTASYHFVRWSTIIAIYELPIGTGSGPRKSIPMWAKGKLGSQLTKPCLCFCLGLLRCLQTRHLATNTPTSFLCPGQ